MMHDRCFFPQAIPLHDLTDILIFLENMQSLLAPSATAIIHEYPPFFLVADDGVEPSSTAEETVMLPLHQSAIWRCV